MKKKDASQMSVDLVKLLISALADVWLNTNQNNLLSAVRVLAYQCCVSIKEKSSAMKLAVRSYKQNC